MLVLPDRNLRRRHDTAGSSETRTNDRCWQARSTGVVNPEEFYKLLQQVDVRIFGFLLGNSSNWPLMQTITRATGGFYDTISNTDDIMGKLLLAGSKINYEALLDAEVMGRFQEYEGGVRETGGWFDPPIVFKDGSLTVPTGPGFGIAAPHDHLKGAKKIV